MASDETRALVLYGWDNRLIPERVPWWREQVAAFGTPVLGLAGPVAAEGKIGATLGGVPNAGVVLRYPFGGVAQVEVTTGKYGLGGTTNLLRRVLEMAATPDVVLPFSVTVTERLVMLPVGEGRSQFRVVEATTGHWSAAGGWKNRHLRLEGSPGTSPDGLVLTEVVLP